MDVCDGRVDDAGFGGAANLGEVGEESGEVEEAAIQSLAALALDGVVGGTALGGVGTAGGLAFAGCDGGFGAAELEGRAGRSAGVRRVGVVGGGGGRERHGHLCSREQGSSVLIIIAGSCGKCGAGKGREIWFLLV